MRKAKCANFQKEQLVVSSESKGTITADVQAKLDEIGISVTQSVGLESWLYVVHVHVYFH